MKHKAVVFDLDGTLLDTLEDLKNAFNAGLRSCGFPERSIDDFRRFVGNGVRKTLERAAPVGTSAEELEKVHAAFKAFYREHLFDNTRPFPGIPELVAELKGKGVPLAVVSNKDDYGVQALCDRWFPGLFETCIGIRSQEERKPDPTCVLRALDCLQMQPCDCVYVGDSEVDIQTAQNTGTDCVSVSWGFRSPEHLLAAGAVCIVSTAEELRQQLLLRIE